MGKRDIMNEHIVPFFSKLKKNVSLHVQNKLAGQNLKV